jgi:endonuclease III
VGEELGTSFFLSITLIKVKVLLTFSQAVMHNILCCIKEKMKGDWKQDFVFFTGFYEIRHKSASLLVWSASETLSTVPVDLHVWEGIQKLNWSDAKNEEECSWQLQQWAPSAEHTKLNDTLGAVGQKKKHWTKTALLQMAQSCDVKELIGKLVN